MEETLTMSNKELDRFKTLHLVLERKITQVAAGKRLNLSERQIRRLLLKLKTQGNKGLISSKRGKPSNREISKDLKNEVLKTLVQYYPDFGPKLANEYLRKYHNFEISTETLRLWMIKSNLWFSNSRERKIHIPRERRPCFGELVQVDGSHHDWFEGRSDPCVLMVFIDDATSAITSLHFAKSESLEAYYESLSKHLVNYGIPRSIYGDRCATLACKNSNELTQFHKALKELGCNLILALSPQAKGRVERANRTLQDRLVKELRLRGISSICEANKMLEEYRNHYNHLFSKKPSEQRDAHRPLDGICLENVLSIREVRTLNKDSIVQFRNTFYKISSQDKKIHLFKGAKIEIRLTSEGKIAAFFKNQMVEVIPLNSETQIMDRKEIMFWRNKKKYAPPATHPYKKAVYLEKLKQEMIEKVV